MRRRITLLQHASTPYDPTQAHVSPDALSLRTLDAAREDRTTFALDEIPSELQKALQSCYQFHVRWASERPAGAPAPFASRVSSGLHVLFTPGEGDGDGAALCQTLKQVFGDEVDCVSPEASFITPPILSTRFAASASAQFYTRLPSLGSLAAYIERSVCSSSSDPDNCRAQAEALRSADSLDINYDSISHALTVSGFWASAPQGGWTEEIAKPVRKGTDQIEVGLLGAEPAKEPEEIKMGGLLGVVGNDDQLKPTLFSFPARHHGLPDEATYSVSSPPPTGLHPTMTITLPQASLHRPPAPPDATCALHTYLTLPSTIFGDKYQLSTTDPLFLSSHNLAALRAVAGETDLEAPDWSVSRWGSTWLLELATPDPTSEEWNVTVPLHLRYLKPSESGIRSAAVPWPVVFWACTAEDGTKMGVNPFDRANLGWDGLFGPRTMFYQLHPAPQPGAPLVEELEVPVLRLENEGLFQGKVIELATVAVISLGFVWVLWKLGLVVRGSGGGADAKKREKRGKAE
ncbi:PIG-X-domain-containing protein [Aspergillus campestris IBT 28561]|uniref:Protein PBN1 n=1 Tax=Aspergillus campestris (strain IBT 28561) TaxID=1392248 RepID=A0A2I1DBL5_ASPC2|nr:PIG-X-domain-containing protein [Aspergillus campestris IBT 28561]PKY07250.1 PIG-X-domain-containing protein [Aspergillus campestris IBT 28561]